MYQFTKDCLTGIAAIDEEHRQLFVLINGAMQTLEQQKTGAAVISPEVLNGLLEDLKQYAMVHFAHEEAYMEEHQDPELERQKKEHQGFADTVNEMAKGLSGDSNEAVMDAMEKLLQFLVKWLYHHILGSDIMIGKLSGKVDESADPFAFTDKYRTGITLVDDEHKRLFEIIRETNEIIHAELLHDKYDEIIHILGELKAYTEMHFRDEEKYMEQISYAGLAAQKLAHEAFVEKLDQIDLQEVDENQQVYLFELIEFLLGWLSNHILKMDKLIPAK
ncbi:MAG: bacteriohemerythrin [Lachnospiraceae bacterium]|nr:bacteriohemerythrin [Lachnospiraceae bacterium]